MKEGIKPPDFDMSVSDMYANAKDMYSVELSTLSQRTNFFLVTQSILIGALAFAFQKDFPYLFPYIISLLVIVSEVLCLITVRSGKESSESMMRWRLYMKHLEAEKDDGPWNWYYKSYQETHKDDKANIINNSPLPFMWLFYPFIFAGIWLFVSFYVPACVFQSKPATIPEEIGHPSGANRPPLG